jgi:hypothetical protein
MFLREVCPTEVLTGGLATTVVFQHGGLSHGGFSLGSERSEAAHPA